MTVFRVNTNKNYTVMSNTHFKEKEMSLKAKGLLSLMLSLPDNWDYSVAGLVTLSKDGKESVTNALCELEQFGYLTRTKATDEKGRFAGYEYNIFESPQATKPQTENPLTGNPSTDNPPQLNTNKYITKELNTKNKKKVSKGSFDAIIAAYAKGNEEITDLLIEWVKVRKAKRAALTDRAIQINIDKLDKLAAQSGMSVPVYLQEVICRGWAAFYPINSYGNNKPAAKVGVNGIAISDKPSDLDDIF